MQPSEWIALVAVVVGPAAALAGVWVQTRLAERTQDRVREATAQADALTAVARMQALILDAQPTLILNNELGEYSSPEDAIAGLYERWLTLREPLVLLAITHPQRDVRMAALDLQASVEMLLRDARLSVHGNDARRVVEYDDVLDAGVRLGQLLSPFEAGDHPVADAKRSNLERMA